MKIIIFRTQFILVLLSIPFTCIFSQETITLYGLVTDANDKELAGVNIHIENSYRGTFTDTNGIFSLKTSKESISLIIDHIGYARETISLKNLSAQHDTLHIVLKSIPIIGTPIVVYEDRNSVEEPLSTKVLDRQSIRNIPQAGETDLNRVLSTLPGVVQTNEYRSSLNIRGGRTDQDLLIMDNHELLYSHHLFGFFSSINQYSFEEVKFYPGYRSTRFGDRVGAVIDIISPSFYDFNNKNHLNLTLLSASGKYHKRWNNFAMFLSGRRTHFELFYPYYGFYDTLGKLMWIANSTLLYSVSFYDQKDYFRTPKDENQSGYTPFWNTKIFSKWGDRYVDFKVNKKLDSGELVGNFGYSNSLMNFPNILDHNINTLKFQMSYLKNSDQLTLESGIQVMYRTFDYEWSRVNTSMIESIEPAFHPAYDISHVDDTYLKYAMYIDSHYKIWESVLLKSGLRVVFLNNYEMLTPSVLLKIKPQTRWSIEIGHYKSLQLLHKLQQEHELQLTSLILPLDKPYKSNNFVLNQVFSLPNKTQLLWENYYREISPMPVFDRFSQVIKTQKQRVIGSDLSILNNTSYFRWQIGVSFLRTLQLYESEKYLSNWDIPFSINGNISLEIAKKWFLSIAGQYRRGLPYTPKIKKFMELDYNWQIIESSPPNIERLPDYSRFDISFRKKFTSKKGFDYTISLQALNVTFTKNVVRNLEDMYGNLSHGKFLEGMPFLPSIGVEYEF